MILALLLAASTTQGREPLGVFDGWGAFRDREPARCFAIAVPARTGRRPAWRPFASIARWPGQRRGDVLFVRLSAARGDDTPVTLSVGERRFRLTGHGSGVWSPDAATDHTLVAALRGQHSMSIEAVSARGEPFADTYLLTGAATAIDAATLGCAGG
ncbi:hypothetical protein [Sphingomonas bacterium]|uniref:hypothetical protein n=1 Tax=Sphingomonas bacterium TaxID=1895847 RepID=UPI0015757288|nr:hypothetical protein [Sphingomonas bacterium]